MTICRSSGQIYEAERNFNVLEIFKPFSMPLSIGATLFVGEHSGERHLCSLPARQQIAGVQGGTRAGESQCDWWSPESESCCCTLPDSSGSGRKSQISAREHRLSQQVSGGSTRGRPRAWYTGLCWILSRSRRDGPGPAPERIFCTPMFSQDCLRLRALEGFAGIGIRPRDGGAGLVAARLPYWDRRLGGQRLWYLPNDRRGIGCSSEFANIRSNPRGPGLAARPPSQLQVVLCGQWEACSHRACADCWEGFHRAVQFMGRGCGQMAKMQQRAKWHS